MKNNPEVIIPHLVGWGEAQPLVRVMILTSTRAIPGSTSDLFSDYDVILALSDIRPFFVERGWLEAFGRVLAVYRDPLQLYLGDMRSCIVTQYEDSLKIDFSLWPVEIIKQIGSMDELPAELDAGYRVLLDKDRLTAGLKPPTYRGYIPTPPSAEAFFENVELFYHEATYMAKYLWRDDLIAARHIFDFLMQEHLLPVLIWQMEIERRWTVKPGAYGRGIKKWLPPEQWAELEGTFAGAGLEENWQAFFKTIALFRKASIAVGEALGYSYPYDLDRRATAYLQKVRELEPGAEDFN